MMKKQVIIEEVFRHVLREVAAREKEEKSYCAYQKETALDVVSQLHAACIGVETGNYARGVDAMGLDDIAVLYNIGFTEVMARETFNQIMTDILASHPCNGETWNQVKCRLKDDAELVDLVESKQRYMLERSYLFTKIAYHETANFKAAYLECAKEISEQDVDRIEEIVRGE